MTDDTYLGHGPESCASLLGQEAQEAAFLEAEKSGFMHHAWLLTGTKGVGKASFAWLAAKYLLVGKDAGSHDLLGDDPKTLSVDPHAPAIRRISEGNHPNLLVLQREPDPKTGKIRKDIPVDAVRRLSAFYSQTANEEGRRICLIDSVDDLNTNAANALLKILEEPPADAVFFLVSHSSGRLLPTIRSRCRQLTFGSLSIETISKLCTELLDRGTPDPAILSLAEGSVGMALALHHGGLSDMMATIAAALSGPASSFQSGQHRLAEKCASVKDQMMAEQLIALFRAELSRAVIALARQRPSGTLLSDALYSSLSNHSLESALALCEKVSRRAQLSQALNLDRKLFWLLTLGDARKGRA